MAINKVIYDGNTLMDVTEDTVTPKTLAKGITAHGANGEPIVGLLPTVTEEEWQGVKTTAQNASDKVDNLEERMDSGEFKGESGVDGERGYGILKVTTAPTAYTTATGGFTPAYRIALSTVKTQAKVDKVFVGDTLAYSYYQYPIGYVDSSYVYVGTRVSIRGGTGAAGKTAYQYAQDGGFAGTEEEFSEKIAKEYNSNPLWGKKISLIGDSICAGSDTEASYLGGYGKIIADRNNMAYENLGKGGSTITAETYSGSTGTAKGWICRMVDNMSADADYAIVEGGINDAWQWYDYNNLTIGEITNGYNATLDDTTYYGAFESMLKKLVTKFQGKKIGYIAVPKMMDMFDSNRKAPNFYHIALECCAKWGVPVCDLNTIVPPFEYIKKLGTDYTVDGTHPTYEGYLKYYCDPIESWMKTLTTAGNFSAGAQQAISTHNEDSTAHADIRALITALQNGKLSNEGVSFKRARLPLADGTTIEIDVLTALNGTIIIPYINQVPISIDTDGSVFNGTGYAKDKRLSSSGALKDQVGCYATGYIPAKKGDVIRIFGCEWGTTLNAQSYICAYDANFNFIGANATAVGDKVSFTVYTADVFDKTNFAVNEKGDATITLIANNIAYIRVSSKGFTTGNDYRYDPKNMIVTVNEEIT